jgi:hypothetical protein
MMSASDIPPASSQPPPQPHTDAAAHSAAVDREAIREELFGGALLLIADIRAVYLLLNEGRARLISRFFGISGPGSGLVTLIMLSLAAETANREVRRALSAPGAPELGDVALGASVLTESVRFVAGATAGEYPLLGPLVLGALVGHAMRPALRSTVHRARSSVHRAHAGLDHRYGHIIRRNPPPSTAPS